MFRKFLLVTSTLYLLLSFIGPLLFLCPGLTNCVAGGGILFTIFIVPSWFIAIPLFLVTGVPEFFLFIRSNKKILKFDSSNNNLSNIAVYELLFFIILCIVMAGILAGAGWLLISLVTMFL